MSYYGLIIIMTLLFSVIMAITCISEIKIKKYDLIFAPVLYWALYVSFLITQYLLSIRINLIIILLVLITIIGDSTVGHCLNRYHRSRYYDRYLHAFGAFSFSLFGYSLLSKLVDRSTPGIALPKFYSAIFVLTIGISVGCITEIVEFILDSNSNKQLKHQHGLTDTNYDLISNLIGAIIASICSIFVVL